MLIRQSGNFTSYNFSAYIREAYQQNTTVYACIQEYVKACASCPIIIKRGDTVIENKTLMTLLQTPNMSQTWDDFWSKQLSIICVVVKHQFMAMQLSRHDYRKS